MTYGDLHYQRNNSGAAQRGGPPGATRARALTFEQKMAQKRQRASALRKEADEIEAECEQLEAQRQALQDEYGC
jgi:hypothetical protein